VDAGARRFLGSCDTCAIFCEYMKKHSRFLVFHAIIKKRCGFAVTATPNRPKEKATFRRKAAKTEAE
jgi:hypothetical protein